MDFNVESELVATCKQIVYQDLCNKSGGSSLADRELQNKIMNLLLDKLEHLIKLNKLMEKNRGVKA